MATVDVPIVRGWTPLLLALLLAAPLAAQDTRLILITCDGLRADVVTPDATPNIAALRAAGCAAAEALNDLPSATLPNHTSLLTGLVADRHGVIANWELPGTIDRPTLFDYAAQAGLRCAFFASKSKLAFLAPPDACELIDVMGGPASMTARLLPQISADGPDVIFVHFSEPDSTGHRNGWLSEEYMAAVALVDGLVGQIVAAVEADSSRPTYFLLTADHGGLGTNHFLNLPENRQIPWIAVGPDIPAASELAETASIVDLLPTALTLLDLPLPDGLSGSARPVRSSGSETDGSLLPVPGVTLPCVILVLPLMVAAAFVWPRRRRGSEGYTS